MNGESLTLVKLIRSFVFLVEIVIHDVVALTYTARTATLPAPLHVHCIPFELDAGQIHDVVALTYTARTATLPAPLHVHCRPFELDAGQIQVGADGTDWVVKRTGGKPGVLLWTRYGALFPA
jgi:hypothetical protein